MMALRDIGYMLRLRILAEKGLSWKKCFNIIMLWEFASTILPSAVGGTTVAAFFIYKRFFIISVIFIILSTFCDMFDGWLARATKQETKFGKIYDVAMDKYVEGFIGLSLAFIMPPFILSGYVWAILGTFGSIIISVISNAALQVTNEKVFKFMSRSDRGLILVLGLLVASQFGDIILTYTAILLTLFSHLTIVLMLFSYKKVLKNK